MINLFADSVTLSGNGQFNLNILKEISGTDSFLGLDQNVRGCQNDEPYDNCTTRHYIKAMRDKCGCLPFPVTIPGNEVHRLLLVVVMKILNNQQERICATKEQLHCTQQILQMNVLEKCLRIVSYMSITFYTFTFRVHFQ